MKVIFLNIVTFIALLESWRIVDSKPLPSEPNWVIVFDAGSTETRMYMYEFLMDQSTTKWIPLRSIKQKWETALSRFDPYKEAGAITKGFQDLLRQAEKDIPKKKRPYTPVFLYATAGLRRLPKRIAKKLLRISRRAIRASSFDKKFPKKEMTRVQMLSGAMEGAFAWLGVNYLISPSIAKQESNKDVGVIDMGGGSTQIAFRPQSSELVEKAEISSSSLQQLGINKATGPGIYSKSFPDYGFSSTTMKYVGAYDDCRKHKNKCPSGKVYRSKCLSPNYQGEFKFGPYEFDIAGKELQKNEDRYSHCTTIAKSIIKKYSKIPEHEISILLHSDSSIFFGVSGYYYIARQIAKYTTVNVPSSNKGPVRCEGYEMTLERFQEGARQLCKNMPRDENDPFLVWACLRSTYVNVLLQYVYKFNPKTIFHMCKTLPVNIKGHTKQMNIGWPLGVAQLAAEKVLEKHT